MDARSPTDALESFGEQLRRLRAAAGMSQGELARRSALSTAGVGALERGARRAPKQDTLALLAEALALDQRERTGLEQAAARGRARSSRARPLASETTHNLPLQLTSFIGRADEIAQITRLINANRLVTVLGSGGVGKTRAALEAATYLADSGAQEVRFIELASLQDGTFIVGLIASALDVRLPDANETAESLARAVKARRVLLIFDSCEHLIAQVTETARVLLQQCPQLKIVATTRERLGITGEVVWRLPPLAVPDANCATIAEARLSSALELFVQRGLSADPDFTFKDQQTRVLVDVCRRLQGIPLAIELAAARLPTLGLETLSGRLEATLGESRGFRDVPDRHQTMRRTLAWSYQLLIEPECLLLRRLGVFAGGCTLPAAESVCAQGDLGTADVAGVLASLVDKSLVNAVIDGETMRYVLLDSTRAFARERLDDAGEQDAFCLRHAHWLVAHGERAVREFASKPNLVWLDEFWPEIDNVRSALEWTLRSRFDEHALLAGRIAGSFRGLWLIPGRFRECRRWIELVLGRIDETQHPLVVANLLTALMQTLAGSQTLAVRDRLVAVLRHLGDRRRLATALSSIALRYCRSGLLMKAQEAIDEARRILIDEGMPDSPSDESDQLAADLLIACSELGLARGQFADARAHVEQATAISQRLGDEYVLNNLSNLSAEIEFVAGNVSLAAVYSEKAVKHASAIARGSALLARALCIDAGIRLSASDIDAGETAARRALHMTSSLGDDELRLISLQNLAALATRRGRPRTGARLLGSIEAWRESTGYRRSPFEAAMYNRVRSSLDEQLGNSVETYVARGRQIPIELAANDALAVDFHDDQTEASPD